MAHVEGHKKEGETKVLGIDLSLACTGVAVLSRTIRTSADAHLERVRTDPRDWAKTTAGTNARLDYITSELVRVAEAFNPDLVVIESASYGSTGGASHERAGLWWRVTGRMLDYAPVATVSPSTLKKYATGSGAGSVSKTVVTEMARDTYGWITEWPTGKVDDIADAVVLAAMGMRWLGISVERESLSDARLSAMDGARWPEAVAA